jgi:hypothetical protein
MRGDFPKAVQLLQERFTVCDQSAEGDTPRHAALWLQRALYEVEFDTAAAAQSLAQSKAMFDRLGGPQPHWKAVSTYLTLRVQSDRARPLALRTAEDAVDQAFMRQRPAVWRVPYMTSL